MPNIIVSNAQELLDAIKVAQANDAILLAPGDYGVIRLRDLSFSAPVTIRSLDPADRAHIEQLDLRDVANLEFADLEFGRALEPGESPYTRFINVNDSADLVFDRIYVHGGLNGDPRDDGYGLKIIQSRDVTVSNSHFEQLSHGVTFQATSGVALVGNTFIDMRSDGAVFAAVTDVLVDRNYFTGFYLKPGDHADAIQFLTAGQPYASTDIVITNNVILQGKGEAAQGIWMRDEDKGLPFENVLIANNLVYMNTWNGISVVGGGSNIEIIGNTVLSDPNQEYRLRIRIGQVDDVRIENNFAHNYLELDSTAVALAGNIFLNQTPADAVRIPKLGAGAAATIEDLIVAGIGYRPNGAPGDPTGPVDPTDPVGSGDPLPLEGSVSELLGKAINTSLDEASQRQAAAQAGAKVAIPQEDSDDPAEDAPVTAAVYSITALDDVKFDLEPDAEQTSGPATAETLSDFLRTDMATALFGDMSHVKTSLSDRFDGSSFETMAHGGERELFDVGGYAPSAMAEFFLHAETVFTA